MLKTLAAAELPQRVRRALEHQLQAATNDLSRQLKVVLRESAQELGRQGERTENPLLHAALLDAARRLRDNPAEFISRFLQELESVLADLRAPRMTHALEELSTPTSGLSLVDDAEMDEGTVLSSIAARSDSRNSLALQLLGYRYGVLASASAFDAEHLPVGPHALCRVLSNTCHAMLPSIAARKLVYQQFERITIPHYPALLDSLNTSLVGDGILPHLSFVPVRVRAATSIASNEASAPDIIPADAQDPSEPVHEKEIDIDSEVVVDVDFAADEFNESDTARALATQTSQWTLAAVDTGTEADGPQAEAPTQGSRDEAIAATPMRIESFAALQVLLGRRRS
ncbi:MAG: DUF1631 family protein, partial [Thermomonas sp.]